MKRFFAKIGRFFWSWGFLKFVLGVILLIVLLYVEEDWRGARAWAATKAEWEAKGESFDPNKFIPPPVPDDQNIAALPLFKLEPFKVYDDLPPSLTFVALRHALRDDLPSLDSPSTSNWQKGELPDMAKIKKVLTSNYSLAVKDATPPDDALQQFNGIYPFFNDFVSDASARPFFRINEDYSIQPPAMRSFGPLTDALKISKILTLHAILALDEEQPDLALRDIKINSTVVSGVARDPSLVGGLVAIASAVIGHGALYDGLAQHAWSDNQLAELEQLLKPINFLATYQLSMRGEVVHSAGNLDYFERMSRRQVESQFGRSFYESPVVLMIGIPWPGGWWADNKSRIASFYFHLLRTVDSKAQLVDPRLADALKNEALEATARWDEFAPWKILAVISVEPLTNAPIRFAQGQVWIDEARIACALERYRLAQGVYPSSLEALAPLYIDAVPHDIMNGQAYHYRLNSDGTFLLYSVGWNQTDEGGTIVYDKDLPKLIDYEQGDWVWPTPK